MIPGIHVSTSGGIHNAPERLRELNLEAGQIFTASQRRWVNPPLTEERISLFRERSQGLFFVSHSSYLINPASSREDVRLKSDLALEAEFRRCTALGIKYIVMHPGAHQNTGLDLGISSIARAIDRVMEEVPGDQLLLLENTAGAGTTIGCRFDELAAIRDTSCYPERIGFCIDTAHAHGAGYSVGTRQFIEQLSEILGLEHIKVFHLNGSKVDLGSRRDRHEHFSMGTISLADIKALYNASEFNHSLGIAETPGTDLERAEDIRLLVE